MSTHFFTKLNPVNENDYDFKRKKKSFSVQNH